MENCITKINNEAHLYTHDTLDVIFRRLSYTQVDNQVSPMVAYNFIKLTKLYAKKV